MSWKRCWNNNYYYEDDQIVPDIDRLGTRVGQGTSSDRRAIDNGAVSSPSLTTPPSSSIKHRSPFQNFSTGTDRLSGGSSASSTSTSMSNNNGFGGMFSRASSSSTSGEHYHHPILMKSSKLGSSSSSASSSFSWSKPFKPSIGFGSDQHRDFYASGASKVSQPGRHSPLGSNDFWEEKYSRIAVITTSHPLASSQSKY